MQVTMYDIVPFVSFIDLIMDSTKTVELVFNPVELKISLLNNSHICFYEAVFKKDFFGDYQVDDVESILVDTSDLHKILKSSKRINELCFESTDSHLILQFESDSGNRRIFELPLIDESYNSPPPPEIDYNLDFLVELSKLEECVFDLDKIIGTDKFKLVVDDGVSVVAPSDVMTNYQCDLDESIDGKCSVSVNTAYIGGLSRLKRVSKIVELKVGDNMPLSWKVSSKMDDVIFKGLIAPIIEEE